jgi:hypothetical protein
VFLAGLSDLEHVALWAGLIVGVASVVLAVVAIYFSIEVDRRSAQTAADTVRSLERIESRVETQSQDTRDLIKVGWERMLGNVEPSSGHRSASDEGIREIAGGLAAEIRSTLGLPERESDTAAAHDDDLRRAVEQLQESLESQLLATRQRPADEVQFWMDRMLELSPGARALVGAISRAHLTAAQVQELRGDPVLAEAVRELRRSGLLVPLEGYDRRGERTLVYWFPPDTARAIRAAELMLPEPPFDLEAEIESKLAVLGYPDRPPTAGDDN